MAGERVTTEQKNRRLRCGIAIAALASMALQVLVGVVLVIVNYLFPSEGPEYA
jgi:tetrahydromethanopterin S-methyltransferase subunit F